MMCDSWANKITAGCSIEVSNWRPFPITETWSWLDRWEEIGILFSWTHWSRRRKHYCLSLKVRSLPFFDSRGYAIRMCALVQEDGFHCGVLNIVTGYGPTLDAAISSHMKMSSPVSPIYEDRQGRGFRSSRRCNCDWGWGWCAYLFWLLLLDRRFNNFYRWLDKITIKCPWPTVILSSTAGIINSSG